MIHPRIRPVRLSLCLLAASVLVGLPTQGQERAFIATDHTVYGVGEPIRLTYWLPSGTGAATLQIDPVVDPDRGPISLAPAEPIDLSDRPGRALIPEVFGELPRGPRPFAGVLDDLTRRTPLAAGLYRVRLEGIAGEPGSNVLQLRVLAEPVESREIPLEKILGIGMPSIRVVHTVSEGGRATTDEGAHALALYRALLASRHPEPDAFVVRGHDSDALRRARAVLADGDPPLSGVQSGGVASVVFHSYGLGSDVHLTAVRWRGNTLEIRYRLVPAVTELMEARFALIPLPALEPGTYRVDIQPEIDGRSMQMELGRWIDRKVSRSFTLEVAR